MMTREEIYGGSVLIAFPGGAGSTVQLSPHIDFRVLVCGNISIVGASITLRLPDPKTVRQHGWLVFVVYNVSSTSLNLHTAIGTSLGFLDPTDVFLVGLISEQFPAGGGTWSVVKKTSSFGAGSSISESVCLGSSSGLGNDVNSYQLTGDVWVTETSIPIVSGSGLDISAGEFTEPTGEIDLYYGQFAEFYEWNPTSTTLKATSNYKFDQTGLGVIQGSPIGDLMHIANAGTQPLDAYKMEVYGVTGDSWTVGLTFPSFTGITAPEVTVCQSIGLETSPANKFTFTSPSTQDSSAVLIAYDQALQIYLVAAYPPWPRGPFRPSCIGIDSRLHFQGGSYSETSAVLSSTTSHQEFNPFLGAWATLPPLPVVGRGLGITSFDNPRDRYTFGMGETTSIPSEVHFEYNLVTLIYRARATFAWGATGRIERESAWGMHKA